MLFLFLLPSLSMAIEELTEIELEPDAQQEQLNLDGHLNKNSIFVMATSSLFVKYDS